MRWHTMRALLTTICVVLLLIPNVSRAQDMTFSVDVPTRIGGPPFFLAYQTVHHSGGVYSLVFDGASSGMTGDVNINALAYTLDGSGDFIFSLDAPFVDIVSGATYEPRDVIYYQQLTGTMSMYLPGSSIGLSPEANIDAILFDASGSVIASFDAPVSLLGPGLTAMPADLLVISSAAFSMVFQGSSAGLGPEVNVCGADIDYSGNLTLCFDAPVNISGIFYLPGDIVRYSGGFFSLYYSDAAFPTANAMTDFALDFVSPGRTPNGDDVLGTVLTITKNSTVIGDIDLNWGTSCLGTFSDYTIHEGRISSGFSSHAGIQCSTSGATARTLTPPNDDTYYLIVPVNANFEGSYGVDSSGTQRPPSTTPCRLNQFITSCP